MLNNSFTRAILPLLLAAGCCAAEASVLTSKDAAMTAQASTNRPAFDIDAAASSARFQPLPVDEPSLPSPPPIPVSEPFTAALLASGLALMAVIKRKQRRTQA